MVLLSLQQPMSGFDVTVTASLWCSLADCGNGAVVWQEAVAASHTATRLASEGAVHQTLRHVVDRVGAGVPLASVNLMSS